MEPRIILRTKPGAGRVVATNLDLQLRPDSPDLLAITAPPSPEGLHRSVSADVNTLSIMAAVVVLAAGVFAATNLMLLSISARIPEIGMRRAMGASATQIIGLVMTESIVIGLVAGVVGTVIGLWTLFGICIANQWAPVVALDIVWVGMIAGMVGGVLGGAIPAIVAARIQPANALRR
jgi:putative ABC transport system permease protein